MTISLSKLASLSAYDEQQKPIRYDVVDRKTGLVVGSAKTRARASQSADKRDIAYGAYRYSVKAIYA